MTSQPIEHDPQRFQDAPATDEESGAPPAWWSRPAGPDPAGDPASPRSASRAAAPRTSAGEESRTYRPALRPPPPQPVTPRDRLRQYQSSDSLRVALQSERARLRAQHMEFEQRESSLVGQLDDIASRLGHVEALLANGPSAGPPAALRSIGSPPPAEAAA